MICTTYFLTFFSELIPPTGKVYVSTFNMQILTLFFRKDNCTFLFLYKARHCFQYEKSSF